MSEVLIASQMELRGNMMSFVIGSEVKWQATGPWMVNASGAETGAMSPFKALGSLLGLHRTLKQQFM